MDVNLIMFFAYSYYVANDNAALRGAQHDQNHSPDMEGKHNTLTVFAMVMLMGFIVCCDLSRRLRTHDATHAIARIPRARPLLADQDQIDPNLPQPEPLNAPARSAPLAP